MIYLETNWTLFFGRLHPLIVHLPIGFLLLAGLFEYFARKPKYQVLKGAVSFTLGLGAISAVAAVILGLMLSNAGGYDESTLFWHKWLGIAVALFSILAWLAKSGKWSASRKTYTGILGTTVALIFLTGHFGGNLTHGSNYLWQYAPAPLAALFGGGGGDMDLPDISSPDSAVVYTHIIQPIMDKRCVSCHNDNKTKGDLNLASVEGIQKGGDGGAIFVAGQTEESEIFRRVTLPQSHKKFMPAEGKTPLTYDQIKLLEWWINTGASFEDAVTEVEVPEVMKPIIERAIGISTDRKPYVETATVEPASADALKKINESGLVVLPLADKNNFLDVRPASIGQEVTADQIKSLNAAKEQITWLNLAKSNVTDDMLSILSELPNLTRLRLEQNPLTDKTINYLKELKHLEYLNLYGTQVSDASLPILKNIPSLKKLFLWQTKVTPEAAETLRNERPDMQVEMGFEFKQLVTGEETEEETG